MNGIKINSLSHSLVNKPLLPQMGRAELRENFAPLSQYKMLLQGLACAFSWGELMLGPGEAATQLQASRSIIKLSGSTFAIPNLIDKGIEIYDNARKVQLCVENNPKNDKQIKKVAKAVAGLFLASINFTNKTSKALSVLHKTKVIDLKKISPNAPGYLGTICFVTSLPALFLSALKLATLVQRYIQVEQTEGGKKALQIKIAICSFKLFCSTLGVASYFFPTLVPPVISLGLSTISFTMGLGQSIANADWEIPPHEPSIALKRRIV